LLVHKRFNQDAAALAGFDDLIVCEDHAVSTFSGWVVEIQV
jgi:hypothetical protein